MDNRRWIVVVVLAVLAAGSRCSNRSQPAESAPAASQSSSQDEPVPGEILAALPTCSVSVSIYPRAAGEDDPGPGLRNVSLYVPEVRLEPVGLWPDGTPVAADLTIPEETARALVAVLASHGFFSRAARRHSEARPEPAAAPPPDSAAGLPERASEPNVEVTVRVQTDDWHLMRIGSWPLGDESRVLLDDLARHAGDEAGAALRQLAASF